MNPIVEFCISNMARGSEVVYQTLENDPGVDVLDYGCASKLWDLFVGTLRTCEW